MPSETITHDTPTTPEALSGPHELATRLIAKLCHDFISPTGAIVSGLDLLSDPSAQDMRDDAIALIQSSSQRLVTLVQFARVAYGAATSAEAFSAKELHKILADVFSGLRAELRFDIAEDTVFEKPAARVLVNLGYIAGNALPTGGVARLTYEPLDNGLRLTAVSEGRRARLKPEAIEGLKGLPLSEGLSGQWIQPYWLHSVIGEAGGRLTVTPGEDRLVIEAELQGPSAQTA